MAYDKIINSVELNNNLSSIANAIRIKSNGNQQLAWPTGFINEIAKIDVCDTYGFKDVSFSNLYFDNNTKKIITGSAYDGNKIVLTTSDGYTRALFMLKKPISIVPNDVIELKLTKTSGSASFSDCFMVIPVIGRMALKQNFTISANTTLTYTETNNSYDIIGIEIGSRLGTWDDVHLTVSCYLNDVQLF